MAVVRKPLRAVETEADKFISGATPATATETESASRVPTMIRFDQDLLRKVDAAAKKRGISRSAWVQYVCSEKLQPDE